MLMCVHYKISSLASDTFPYYARSNFNPYGTVRRLNPKILSWKLMKMLFISKSAETEV